MYRALLLPVVLLCAGPLFAQPKWITMQNENFLVYSSAGARDTQVALENFERVRSFFIQFTGAAPQKPVPISIMIFGSEKEYQPYRFKDFAIAYYASQSGRDFIVIGKLGDESSRIANHEYTHLVMRHFGYNLPPWLNEGIAELFSTLKPIGKDTEFGNIILWRLQALSREAWVPLRTILEADEKSPYYNETKKAGNLYNESWALVHMLATSNEYRFKFWDMVKMIREGTPSVEALEKTYRVPFAQLEKDLRFYVSSDGFHKLAVNIKLEGMDKIPAKPADLLDVRIAQAELLMGLPDNQAEVKARFEALTRADAKRPSPWSSLGYLAWRDGKPDLAIELFAKSYALGNRSPRMLRDYARLGAREHPDDAVAAFKTLIEVEPQDPDHRLDLAGLLMVQRKYAEALEAARSVKSVRTVDQRDRILYIRAAAAAQSGDRDEARSRAEELKRLTASKEYTARAEQILLALSPVAVQQSAAARTPGIVADESIDRPALQERETQAPTMKDMEMILQDIQGVLVEMDCSSPPKFILSTAGGLKRYLVLQPDRLIVTGRAGGAEFACGLQKPVQAIRLQFTIAPEGSNAHGVVRAVHFGETK